MASRRREPRLVKAARKPRRVVFVGDVAGGPGHAGAPAATDLFAVPRPFGMILAHPAGGPDSASAAARQASVRNRPRPEPAAFAMGRTPNKIFTHGILGRRKAALDIKACRLNGSRS
jgi:hypothetical protein